MAGFYNSYKTVGSSSYKIDPFTGQVIPGYVSEEEYLGGLSQSQLQSYNEATSVGQLYGEPAETSAPTQPTTTTPTPTGTTTPTPTTTAAPSPVLTNAQGQTGAFSYGGQTSVNPNLISMTVANPYVRAMMEAGLQNGTTYNILTPEGYNQMLAARQTELQAAVVDPLKAAEIESMRGVAGYLNKQGKFGSSALPSQLMRTSESYNANIASELAKANLDIYGQLDAQRESELNRLYSGGVAQLESETQRQIAAASTALGYEELAQNWNQFTIANESDLYKFRESLDLERLQTINPDTGNPYQYDVELAKIGESQASRADQLAMFHETLQYDYAGLGLEQDKLSWQKAAWNKEMNQRIYEFDVTTQQDFNEFTAELNWAKEAKLIDDNQARDMFEQNLRYQMDTRDITNAENIRQFNQSMDWAKQQGYMDDAREREIQLAVLSEQARQFNVTSDQWLDNFNESMRQFGISVEEQRWYAEQTLALQAKELEGTQDGQYLSDILTIMNMPQMKSWLKENPEDNALLMVDLLEYMQNGGSLDAVRDAATPDDAMNIIDKGVEMEANA